MYLSELNIWNFRKYGEIKEEEEIYPGLSLKLNSGFNLLVGENDSGKSAIIDAIKYTILTQSYDYIRLEEEDFHLSEDEEVARGANKNGLPIHEIDQNRKGKYFHYHPYKRTPKMHSFYGKAQ